MSVFSFCLQNLPKLCCHLVECIISFAQDEILQQRIIDCGAIWYLLTYLFKYDYTLEECGVERSEEANVQVSKKDASYDFSERNRSYPTYK